MNLYEQMQSGQFQDERYMSFTYDGFGFYQLMPQDKFTDKTGQKLSDAPHGKYKFHLSVDVDDLERAWDIVANKLLNHTHAHMAKVTKPDVVQRFNRPDYPQAGKMITLYTFEEISPEVYKQLVVDIEQALNAGGIKPGPEIHRDRMIPGGQYTGYRIEKDENGEYINQAQIAMDRSMPVYNPLGQYDPLADFEIRDQNPNLESWFNVTSSGVSKFYYVLDDKSPEQQQAMREFLDGHGIAPQEKRSSLHGGCDVLGVTGHDMAKLVELQEKQMRGENITPLAKVERQIGTQKKVVPKRAPNR
jgi:hypothetical protein